jgi:hypothetical protein
MKQTLTLSECTTILQIIQSRGSMRSKATDRALFAALLICGGEARSWTWESVLYEALYLPTALFLALRDVATSKRLTMLPYTQSHFISAHWVHGTKREDAIFTVGSKPLTTQEVTRRLKRYARMAGIPSERMSLRTVCNTHSLFLDLFTDADHMAEALNLHALRVTRTSSAGTVLPSVKWNFSATAVKTRVERDPRLHGIRRRSALKPA